MSQDVAVVGVYETRQSRRIDKPTMRLLIEATHGALADAGLDKNAIDGVAGEWPGPGGSAAAPGAFDWAKQLGGNVTWIEDTMPAGPLAVMRAAAAIRDGLCSTVLVVGGQSQVVPPPGSAVMAYTRAPNEFMETWGATTPIQFAMTAVRHMHLFGTTQEQLATVSATIRNHGHLNPNAVMYGRGPYTVDDVLESRWICEPFHILDLSLVSEGATAIILTNRVDSVRSKPVYVLGGAADFADNAYVSPTIYDEIGRLGERAIQRVLGRAQVGIEDFDVFELYDATCFEIIRQYEILGFCDEGEGGAFVEDGKLALGGSHPTNTDGGLLSHAHLRLQQMTQKVIEATQQLRGEAGERQVPGAQLAAVGSGGPAPGFYSFCVLANEPR